MKHNIRTDYLDKVYDLRAFAKLLKRATKAIKAFEKTTPFDAIAFTGMSGAALAFPLSLALKKPLICIRKECDDSHYEEEFEGCYDAKTFIVVDDCICSGRTLKKIKSVAKGCHLGKLVGVYLYDDPQRDPAYFKVPLILDQF